MGADVRCLDAKFYPSQGPDYTVGQVGAGFLSADDERGTKGWSEYLYSPDESYYTGCCLNAEGVRSDGDKYSACSGNSCSEDIGYVWWITDYNTAKRSCKVSDSPKEGSSRYL